MKAHDWCSTDGIAGEHAGKNEVDVHNHAVSGHAIFANHAQKLEVIQHGDQGSGQVRHHLGGAVDAGVSQWPQLQLGCYQAQRSAVGADKIYHLHRMFTDTVGLTIHDYIQRRQLTEAAS